MRLATISGADGDAVAIVLHDGSAVPVAAAARDMQGLDAGAIEAGGMRAVIDGGTDALARLREIADAAERGRAGIRLEAGGFGWRAPIVPRKNVMCVGRNYAEHIAEGNRARNQSIGVGEHPVFFTKPPTAVIAHGDPILVFPDVSTAIDYEVELAVVIGKPGRGIPRERAMDHVFGYTVLNDVTARDLQARHGGQFFKGKGLDGSCPIGPWIVTADAVGDPHDLSIALSVNGEARQDGSTRDMIFDIPTLIASLSEGMTLEAGDIIATGTPSGVGYAMDPPRFLKEGDRVACTIERIGTLENGVRNA